MSRGFLTLINIQFTNVLNSLIMTGRKKSKTKNFLPLLFPILLGLYLGATMSIAFVNILKPEEIYIVFGIIAIMGVFLIFTFTIYQIGGHLFKCKDYELLNSLPIKKWQILLSKIISFYLYQYIYVFAMLLIPTYFYVVNGGILLNIPLIYLLSLFIPIMPIVAGALCALIVNYAASFFKNKAFISIVLYIVLVLFVMVTINSFSFIDESSILSGASAFLKLFAYYPWVFYFVSLINKFSIINVMIYLVINLIPLCIFVGVFANTFDYLNKQLNRNVKAKSSTIRFKAYTRNSIQIALVKKEIHRYFQMPMYVLNTIIGPLMIVIMTGACFIMPMEEIAIYLSYPEIVEMLTMAVLGCSAFCVSIGATTASSISLEGGYIGLLKSLPLKSKDIIDAKILMNVVIITPISVIALIILGLKLNMGISSVLILVIGVIIAVFYSAYVGMIANLHFPRFDWINEATVVKQSASVLISMLINLLTIVGLGFIAMYTQSSLGANMALVLSLTIMTAMTLLLRLYINKNATKLFDRL